MVVTDVVVLCLVHNVCVNAEAMITPTAGIGDISALAALAEIKRMAGACRHYGSRAWYLE